MLYAVFWITGKLRLLSAINILVSWYWALWKVSNISVQTYWSMAPYRKQVLHHFIHYNRNAYLGDSVSYAVLRQGNNASWCCRKLACNNIGRYWGNIRDLILQNLRNVRFCVVHLSYIFCSSNSFERIDEAKHLRQCIWKNYITIIWSGFCFNSAHVIVLVVLFIVT